MRLDPESVASASFPGGRRCNGTLPWGSVTPDAIEGLAYFAKRDDKQAIARLAPSLDELVRIGGSHAQRDMFVHTLVAAYVRAGLGENADAVARRIPWRVDRGAALLIQRAATRASSQGDIVTVKPMEQAQNGTVSG